MNTLSRCAAAALVVTVASAAAHAQFRQPGLEIHAQPQVMIPAGGTDLFRAFLDREGIQPVRLNDVQHVDESRTIVILLGNPNYIINNVDVMQFARGVIQNGGAVLIASDTPFALFDAFRQQVGWFHGSHLYATDERTAHQPPNARPGVWRDCPYVVPTSPEELPNPPKQPGRVWSVFRGLNRVATNTPTYIHMTRYQSEYQFAVARLPRSVSERRGFALPVRDDPVFAVGGDGPRTRLDGSDGYSFLAMADPGVFINLMLMEPGTDNLELTLRTIEYLQGPDKTRDRCFFFENGRVQDRFDGLRHALARPKPKIPPEAAPNLGPLFGRNQDKLVDLANGLSDQLQKRDALHRALVGPPGSSAERRAFGKWVEVMAVFASVFIVLILLRRVWRARQPLDVPPPPATGAGAAATGPPGVFDRRQKELLRRNNLYEPVRDLVREFFASVGAPADPGPRMPRLEISDVVRKPDSLRQALRDMWRLAYGPPMTITAQRWFELEPYFDRLKQAHADGKWRFLTEE
jgi:hypothetical protein